VPMPAPAINIEKLENEIVDKSKTDEDEFYMDALIAIIKEFNTTPTLIKYLTLFALLLSFVIFILVIVYTIILFNDYKNSTLIKNPLNRESLDYNISRGLSFNPKSVFDKNVKYKFVLFLILPVIIFILCLIIIYLIYAEEAPVNTVVKLIVGLLIIQSVISIIVNFIAFYSINKEIEAIQTKISNFNNYALMNFYTKPDFLAVLQNVPTNSFSLIKAIEIALDNMDPNDKKDPVQVSKAILTLNIYIHLQRMGYQNPNILDAFDLFDPVNLNPGVFSLSDFFNRSPIVIDNNTTKIIDIYKSRIPNLLPPSVFTVTSSVAATPAAPTASAATNEETPSIVKKTNNLSDKLSGFIHRPLRMKEPDVINEVYQKIKSTFFAFAEGFDTPEIQNSNGISDDVFTIAQGPLEGWIDNLNTLLYDFDPEQGFSNFIKVLIFIAIMTLLPTFVLLKSKKLRTLFIQICFKILKITFTKLI